VPVNKNVVSHINSPLSRATQLCSTKCRSYFARRYILLTNSVEEIAIQDGDKNVRETDPLKQVVDEQVEGL